MAFHPEQGIYIFSLDENNDSQSPDAVHPLKVPES
jgi:hypothetical protein